MDLTFKEPVAAHVHAEGGQPERLKIRDVREGLAAVNRYGLGGCQCDSVVWQRAVHKLVQAALHPSPEDIEAARQALLDLAQQR